MRQPDSALSFIDIAFHDGTCPDQVPHRRTELKCRSPALAAVDSTRARHPSREETHGMFCLFRD